MVHTVSPKIVVVCSFREEGGRAKSQTRNFTGRASRPARPISPPTSTNMGDEDESNDTNVQTWPQWTNICEMGRWFDDLIAARTHIDEYWSFN